MNFESVNSGMRAIIESGYHEGIFETSKNF